MSSMYEKLNLARFDAPSLTKEAGIASRAKKVLLSNTRRAGRGVSRAAERNSGRLAVFASGAGGTVVGMGLASEMKKSAALRKQAFFFPAVGKGLIGSGLLGALGGALAGGGMRAHAISKLRGLSPTQMQKLFADGWAARSAQTAAAKAAGGKMPLMTHTQAEATRNADALARMGRSTGPGGFAMDIVPKGRWESLKHHAGLHWKDVGRSALSGAATGLIGAVGTRAAYNMARRQAMINTAKKYAPYAAVGGLGLGMALS